jgi:hypothetical protein
MRYHFCSTCIAILMASLCFAQAKPTDDATAKKAEEIKQIAKEKLLSLLNDDRAWEPDGPGNPKASSGVSSQPWGESALAARALVNAGEDPATNAKLGAAVEKISKAKIKGVYALSERIQLLNNPIFKKKYDKVVDADFKLLTEALTDEGMFPYVVGQDGRDLSCTYYGWCGLLERKQKIPVAAWKVLVNKLLLLQVRGSDEPPPNSELPAHEMAGGWCYIRNGDRLNSPPTIAMTAEAVYLLLMARDSFKDKKVLSKIDGAIDDGMAFLVRQLPLSKRPEAPYSLLALQRLAALKPQELAATNWYATAIKALSGRSGGHGQVAGAAMTLQVVITGDPAAKAP